jgi:glutathione S-transferase
VPTLVLDDGAVLLDSPSILDYLDSLVPPERALFPAKEPARHRALAVAALATGFADKAVSLFYEKRMHREVSPAWVERCRAQMAAALAALESDRAGRPGPYWFGDRLGHADIAVATALRFAGEAHPGVISLAPYPALAAHAARLEALPAFQQIQQTFIPPS